MCSTRSASTVLGVGVPSCRCLAAFLVQFNSRAAGVSRWRLRWRGLGTRYSCGRAFGGWIGGLCCNPPFLAGSQGFASELSSRCCLQTRSIGSSRSQTNLHLCHARHAPRDSSVVGHDLAVASTSFLQQWWRCLIHSCQWLASTSFLQRRWQPEIRSKPFFSIPQQSWATTCTIQV